MVTVVAAEQPKKVDERHSDAENRGTNIDG
jgi:hypothetical protein